MNQTNPFDIQRRVISHMTSESWKNVPHVSYLYEPDITDFCHECDLLLKDEKKQSKKFSWNTIILKTIVEGLKSAPELNSHISYHHRKGEGSLNTFEEINISLPWLLPDGKMITPVILNAGSMTLQELSDAVCELREKISNTNIDELLYQAIKTDTLHELKKLNLGIFRRIFAAKLSFHPIRGLKGKKKTEYYSISKQHRLTDRNLTSGTVTISNIGSLYREQRGQFGILEIVPPQILAVGVGAIQEKPGIYIGEDGEKKIGIRKVLPMCIAFDHRAIDFNNLVPFLKRLDKIFAEPSEIHNW